MGVSGSSFRKCWVDPLVPEQNVPLVVPKDRGCVGALVNFLKVFIPDYVSP